MSYLAIFRVDRKKHHLNSCYRNDDSSLGWLEIPWTWGSIHEHVSEKSLMQLHADSPAHRQPGTMIPLTIRPLHLSLLHNQRE